MGSTEVVPHYERERWSAFQQQQNVGVLVRVVGHELLDLIADRQRKIIQIDEELDLVARLRRRRIVLKEREGRIHQRRIDRRSQRTARLYGDEVTEHDPLTSGKRCRTAWRDNKRITCSYRPATRP